MPFGSPYAAEKGRPLFAVRTVKKDGHCVKRRILAGFSSKLSNIANSPLIYCYTTRNLVVSLAFDAFCAIMDIKRISVFSRRFYIMSVWRWRCES